MLRHDPTELRRRWRGFVSALRTTLSEPPLRSSLHATATERPLHAEATERPHAKPTERLAHGALDLAASEPMTDVVIDAWEDGCAATRASASVSGTHRFLLIELDAFEKAVVAQRAHRPAERSRTRAAARALLDRMAFLFRESMTARTLVAHMSESLRLAATPHSISEVEPRHADALAELADASQVRGDGRGADVAFELDERVVRDELPRKLERS